MPEPLTGVVKGQPRDAIRARHQTLPGRFATRWLAGLATILLLGVEGARAICPCGDGICGGTTCFPPETAQTCPADCGGPPPPPPPPPTELTVSRVTVVPFGDPGRFNLHVDNTTLATNVGNGGRTGPHPFPPGVHTLSETAGAGTSLANYRSTICGTCALDGTMPPVGRHSCSLTHLRLPAPPPAPGCNTACVHQLFQCGAGGEPSDFCFDVFNRCLNRCDIPSARRLTIARYASPGMPSVDLTERDADDILAEMSNVLRTFDVTDDIDCNVAFCREGTIDEFAIGDGIVDTEEEETAIFALPQVIKVVKNIFICGGVFQAANGCRQGHTFMVRRLSAIGVVPHDGINWAHEYGHTRGLEHRDPDDPRAVMTWNGTTPDSRRINSRECSAYRSGASLATVDFSRLGLASPVATDGPAPLADIRDFVHRFFVHGIPYAEAVRYGAHVVPTLLEMLADPREAPAWPNIVLVLGMLGDERAVPPLIALIEQPLGGELDAVHYDAKSNALLALGYLVHQSRNQHALTYLRDGAEPAAWGQRGIAWTSPEHKTAAERDRDLSRMAIIGLGLSGDPSAAEALHALLTPAPTAPGRAFREHMRAVIWEALRANQRIAAEGLAQYYRTPPP
jgi:hypothetical protein